MTTPPKMTVQEFREGGYLAEANRRFFHPLGLALGVVTFGPDEGEIHVFDFRGDPEGVSYADDLMPSVTEHAKAISEEASRREEDRRKALGYWIQPITKSYILKRKTVR